jgi:hypothetical protein
MRRWFKFGLVGLLVFGAIAVLITGAALAQDEPQPTPEAPGPQLRGFGFGKGMGDQVELEAAADALGMTVDELTTQMWGGKSLADLAEEKGVDLTTVQEAVQAARESEMRQSIEQAVEDGTLTQEHADWLLEGLDKGFLGGFGFGHGLMGGFGDGFHGRGFKNFSPPENLPQSTPSDNG